MDIVLASGNKGKLVEFQALLSPYDIKLIPQSELGIDSPEETGLSFIENAILKARYASARSGLPALADDSGLSIDALNGAPGIYSARYAGENASDQNNIDLALTNLAGVPAAKRTARFNCALALLRHESDPTPIVCCGQWEGEILAEQVGRGGFGYDPIFWLVDQQCSAAEMSKEDKGAISHRGLAIRTLLEEIKRTRFANV
mgnify:FL=1